MPPDRSFHIKLPTGDWKQLQAHFGAPVWILSGGASVLLYRTIYLPNDAKEVPLPDFCSPIVDAEGRSIYCTECEKEATASCLKMHVVVFDYLGAIVRDYHVALGPQWSPPVGLAKEADLLVTRPIASPYPISPELTNAQCAVGAVSEAGLNILSEAPACANDWLNREVMAANGSEAARAAD